MGWSQTYRFSRQSDGLEFDFSVDTTMKGWKWPFLNPELSWKKDGETRSTIHGSLMCQRQWQLEISLPFVSLRLESANFSLLCRRKGIRKNKRDREDDFMHCHRIRNDITARSFFLIVQSLYYPCSVEILKIFCRSLQYVSAPFHLLLPADVISALN